MNHPTVETIYLAGSAALSGWKLNAFKGGQLAAPDQIQDQFDAVVSTLAEYVDHASVWINSDTGQPIDAWRAMVLLTQFDEQS